MHFHLCIAFLQWNEFSQCKRVTKFKNELSEKENCKNFVIRTRIAFEKCEISCEKTKFIWTLKTGNLQCTTAYLVAHSICVRKKSKVFASTNIEESVEKPKEKKIVILRRNTSRFCTCTNHFLFRSLSRIIEEYRTHRKKSINKHIDNVITEEKFEAIESRSGGKILKNKGERCLCSLSFSLHSLRRVFVCVGVWICFWRIEFYLFLSLLFLGSSQTKIRTPHTGSINVNFCTHCKNRLNANRFTSCIQFLATVRPNRLTAIAFCSVQTIL